jgi:hypothetical protein
MLAASRFVVHGLAVIGYAVAIFAADRREDLH